MDTSLSASNYDPIQTPNQLLEENVSHRLDETASHTENLVNGTFENDLSKLFFPQTAPKTHLPPCKFPKLNINPEDESMKTYSSWRLFVIQHEIWLKQFEVVDSVQKKNLFLLNITPGTLLVIKDAFEEVLGEKNDSAEGFDIIQE